MSSLYECFHIWGAFTESCLACLLAHALLLAYAFNFLPFDHIANGQLLPFSTFNGTRFNLQHELSWPRVYTYIIWIIYFFYLNIERLEHHLHTMCVQCNKKITYKRRVWIKESIWFKSLLNSLMHDKDIKYN